MVSRLVNPQNPAFRFTVAKAHSHKKTLFGTKKLTHWAIVSEHMQLPIVVSSMGATNFKTWSKDKEVDFAFQFEERNQNKLWRNLQFLFASSTAKKFSENDMLALVACFIEVSKGDESTGEITDSFLMDILARNIPLLQPPEMILWSLALKDSKISADG